MSGNAARRGKLPEVSEPVSAEAVGDDPPSTGSAAKRPRAAAAVQAAVPATAASVIEGGTFPARTIYELDAWCRYADTEIEALHGRLDSLIRTQDEINSCLCTKCDTVIAQSTRNYAHCNEQIQLLRTQFLDTPFPKDAAAGNVKRLEESLEACNKLLLDHLQKCNILAQKPATLPPPPTRLHPNITPINKL